MLHWPGGSVQFDLDPVLLHLGAHFNPTYVWELPFLKGRKRGKRGCHGYKKDGMAA
jgi:hypothetical protein